MRNRKLTRLSRFDYSKPRYYFVTICVKDHHKTFGSISGKSMRLSVNGTIAMEQWQWLGDQYPYIDLVSFVVMPDHVHGIIYIDSNYYFNCECVWNGRDIDVGNGRDRSLHNTGEYFANNIDQPKIKPLPELIGAYKTTVSKRIHLAGDIDFKWQKSYHDHIIRNLNELRIIKRYIEKNPENWIDKSYDFV